MSVEGKTVAALIPAYNEESQIGGVLSSIPAYVDHIVVVDDASTDTTRAIVSEWSRRDPRVHLIALDRNVGCGGAIAQACKWSRDRAIDVAVAIDGDGQMDVNEMINLVRPIVDGRADLTKGNRLILPAHWSDIPRVRLLGNAALSLLTKIASGYWSVADSQSGYVALSLYALAEIDWDSLYRGYGRPNDLLVKANVANCRVADVPVKPIYGVGERSSMKIMKVVFAISFMLFRRFWWRLFHKYVLRDFHPLVFFYLLAVATFIADLALSVRLMTLWVTDGSVPPITALAVAFLTITTLNSTFFAFWMDMLVNQPLSVRVPEYFSRRSELAQSAMPLPEARGTPGPPVQREQPPEASSAASRRASD